jgi:hypothetical protein
MKAFTRCTRGAASQRFRAENFGRVAHLALAAAGWTKKKLEMAYAQGSGSLPRG